MKMGTQMLRMDDISQLTQVDSSCWHQDSIVLLHESVLARIGGTHPKKDLAKVDIERTTSAWRKLS